MSQRIVNSSHSQASGLSQLIRRLIKWTDPEKVFILSASFTDTITENIFIRSPVKQSYPTQYDLLVLTNETAGSNVWEQMIDFHSQENLMPIFIPVSLFNEWLSNGNPFACKVIKQAFLWYDRGLTGMSVPGISDPQRLKSQKNEVWLQISGARRLLKEAEDLGRQKQFQTLLATIKKAFQQVFTAVITALMGLPVDGLPSARLFFYGRNLLPGVTDLFPLHDEKEKRLFQLLTEDSSADIQEAEAMVLLYRVRKIWQMAIRIEI